MQVCTVQKGSQRINQSLTEADAKKVHKVNWEASHYEAEMLPSPKSSLRHKLSVW